MVSPYKVVLAYLRKKAEAEIPVGLTDQQQRMLHEWDRGNNPYIKRINQNIKTSPEDVFKGLTRADKEKLLGWCVHKIQNISNPPGETPTTESTEELLDSKGDTFSTEKELDKHLVKQLSRVIDSGLNKSLTIGDRGKAVVEDDKKAEN
jgi:DNA-directed RNA polymerase specialized sigma subunit